MDIMQALQQLLNPANMGENIMDAGKAFINLPGDTINRIPAAMDNMNFYDDRTPQPAPGGVPMFDPATGKPQTAGGFSDQAPTGFGPSGTNPNVGPGLETQMGGGGIVGGGPIPSPEALAPLVPEYGGGAGQSTIGDPDMPTPRGMGEQTPGVAESLDIVGHQGEIGPNGGVPNTEQVGPATVYTIQPGDSLSLIGAMFGLTYDELIAGNEDLLGEKGKSSVIHPGQKILISAPPGTAARGSKEREGVADKGLDVKGATEYSKARRG